MLETIHLLQDSDFPAIRRQRVDTLQVNLGYLCNQSCVHCHVNAGPTRTELMDKQTIEQVIQVLDTLPVSTLDLTGGAPEMNPHFRYLVKAASARKVKVIDRCNLTILFERGQEDLAEFLASHRVAICASLPCYSESNVEAQRGKGVFGTSIAALQRLNALGYGRDAELELNLVYNPVGPVLPPAQRPLQEEYKARLYDDFEIVFNELLTITNMPIKRFGSTLLSKGTFEQYMQLLKDNYSAANLDGVMCRTLLSVDWQGYLYDCDFNQMLGMNIPKTASKTGKAGKHLTDLLLEAQDEEEISVADHCFACTAGQGSSCGGALV